MKKTIVVLLACILSYSAFAQLLVESNGNVGLKNSDTQQIQSYFAVNSPGYPEISSYVLSDDDTHNTGFKLNKRETVSESGDYNKGIDCRVRDGLSSTKKAFGFYSHVYKNTLTETNIGRTYGIYAVAGNATPGWNYGVFGTLFGTNNGAGVFGSSESWDGGMDTGGRYAGFFHGKVKVTNTVEATAFNLSSDYRLKENIESVEPGNIYNIMKLNVVQYNLKQRSVDVGDTATVPVSYYTEDPDLLQKKHYGLIAQELQDIYPDLVYEGGDGFLSVNYVELIPLLIESIQSLKQEVDQLKGNQKASKRVNTSSPIKSEGFMPSVNKISVSAKSITIECSIPDAVKNASVLIFDTNGNQYYSDRVIERGHIEINIRDLTMDSGIYLCSLVTDEDKDSRRFYYGN